MDWAYEKLGSSSKEPCTSWHSKSEIKGISETAYLHRWLLFFRILYPQFQRNNKICHYQFEVFVHYKGMVVPPRPFTTTLALCQPNLSANSATFTLAIHSPMCSESLPLHYTNLILQSRNSCLSTIDSWSLVTTYPSFNIENGRSRPQHTTYLRYLPALSSPWRSSELDLWIRSDRVE